MSSAERKADALLDKGRKHLDAGQRELAEACFRQAAKTYLTPAALNNWALCRYLAGDYKEVLSLLQPLIASADLLPFSRALASLAYSAQGEAARACEQVRAAVRDFDRGLALGASADPRWVEYTTLIKQAAGKAGEHRLVLDLHGRWPGRDLPIGAFAAGVAAFNLGKFSQAAKFWRRIIDPAWARAREPYVLVADLAEQGVVPPFALDYEPNHEWPSKERTEDAVKALMTKGSVRVLFIATAFTAGESGAEMIDALISQTGSWGIDLGRRLLAGSRVSISLKMGAAKALTDAGIFSPGQPIPVNHEGRATTITLQLKKMEIPDPELDRKVDEAIRLRDAGRRDAAYELLARLEAEGIVYPPALVTLANLMRDKGDLDAARSKLELAEKLTPENPVVLFNLAGLWLQLGDSRRAIEYAERINPERTTPAFRQRLAEFKTYLAGLVTTLPSPEALGDAYRAEVEEKPISMDVRLRTALRQIPVQWLNAAAALYRVESAPKRAERERLVAEAILDPSRRGRRLAEEDAETKAALRFLLENGGWAKLQTLTRRFGKMDGDGYWWDEQPPASPLGRLRLLGLLFVGRAYIDGKRHKIAVVPVELRGMEGG